MQFWWQHCLCFPDTFKISHVCGNWAPQVLSPVDHRCNFTSVVVSKRLILDSLLNLFSWFWGPVITLQDCLGAFFSADDLKGDNMYSCEKCKKSVWLVVELWLVVEYHNLHHVFDFTTTLVVCLILLVEVFVAACGNTINSSLSLFTEQTR